MNRKEYMERLWMDLQDLDHSTAEEIIQDFEHHFEQGRKEGRSEEEIARELGDPVRRPRSENRFFFFFWKSES